MTTEVIDLAQLELEVEQLIAQNLSLREENTELKRSLHYTRHQEVQLRRGNQEAQDRIKHIISRLKDNV